MKEGDIFKVTTDRCNYLEVVAMPMEKWGCFSLIQRRDFPTSLVLYPESNYSYMGNAFEDPQLKERLKNIMEVDSWMHNGKPIPDTPNYQVAVLEWRKSIREYDNRRAGTYFNVLLTQPTGQTAIVNIYFFPKSVGSVWKVYFPGKEIIVNQDLTIDPGQPLSEWNQVICEKIRELFPKL